MRINPTIELNRPTVKAQTMREIIVPRDLVLRDPWFFGKGVWAGRSFIGMNYWAAKEIGCEFPYPKTTAVVCQDVAWTHGGWGSGYGIEEVFLHEQQEAQFMQLGCNYPHAHDMTTKLCGPDHNTPRLSHKQVLELVKL